MRPIAALFLFTIRQMLFSRKIWLTLLFLSGPSGLLLIIRNFGPPIDAEELWHMYHVMAQFLIIMGLIPLICIVHGTALVGADVEARTIVYLITRRMHRAGVLTVKYIATGFVLAILCDLAMVGLHLCALAGRNVPALVTNSDYAGWSPAHDLSCYLQVIPLAAFGFLAIFNLFGVLTSRPLTMSVLYFVVVELVLANLPLRARVYSMMHHLRATLAGLMPSVSELYGVPPALRAELFPKDAGALPELFGVIFVALALASIFVSRRELVPTRASRET